MSIMVVYVASWTDTYVLCGPHYIQGEYYSDTPYRTLMERLKNDETGYDLFDTSKSIAVKRHDRRVPLVLFDNEAEAYLKIARKIF